MKKILQILGLAAIILLVIFILGINEAFGSGIAGVGIQPGQCFENEWGLLTCVI